MSIDTESYFLVPDESKKAFARIIEERRGTQKRLNVFFTIGYYNANYYYLAQLLCLSKLQLNSNTFFYVILSDTDIAYKHKTGPASVNEMYLIEKNIVELRNVLVSFGVPEQNIFVRRLSETVLRLIEVNKVGVLNLFHGLIQFPIQELKMPESMTIIQYRPKKYTYTLAYAFRVFCDALFSQNFHLLYPTDCPEKIDLYVAGFGGSPLTLKIRHFLTEKKLADQLPPVIFTPQIPCFGRGELVKGPFNIPDWDMEPREILAVIQQYKVHEDHINWLFGHPPLSELNDYYGFVNNTIAKITSKPSLSKLALDRKRVLLAFNLWLFLNQVKNQVHTSTPNQNLEIDEKEKIKEIASLLRSQTTLDILALANGEYTITQIAKKLGKQDSNISKTITMLKQHDLIRINEQKKVEKGVSNIRFKL